MTLRPCALPAPTAAGQLHDDAAIIRAAQPRRCPPRGFANVHVRSAAICSAAAMTFAAWRAACRRVVIAKRRSSSVGGDGRRARDRRLIARRTRSSAGKRPSTPAGLAAGVRIDASTQGHLDAGRPRDPRAAKRCAPPRPKDDLGDDQRRSMRQRPTPHVINIRGREASGRAGNCSRRNARSPHGSEPCESEREGEARCRHPRTAREPKSDAGEIRSSGPRSDLSAARNAG